MRKNVIGNVVGFISSSCSYFLVYRLIINNIGMEALGVWSIIFGFLAVITGSSTGITTTLINNLMVNEKYKNNDERGKLLFNSLLLQAVIFFIFSIIMLIISWFFLKDIFLKEQMLILAIIISIFFLMIGFSFNSLFDSQKEGFIRNILASLCAWIFYFVALLLIKQLSLSGVGIAYLIQTSTLCFLLYVVARKRYNFKLIYKFDLKQIMDLWTSSWKLHTISLTTVIYDPVTKYFISKYGNLSFVGIFELGNRLVSQIRTLIITSNQVLMPYLILEKGDECSSKYQLLLKVFKNNILFSTYLFSCLFLALPFLKIFFQQNTSDNELLHVISFLMIGNVMNIACGVFYFYYIINGFIKKVLISHIIIAILNFLLPLIIKGNGSTITLLWSFSLFLGSLYIIYTFIKESSFTFSQLFRISWKSLFFLLLTMMFVFFFSVFEIHIIIYFLASVCLTIIFGIYLIRYIKEDKKNIQFQ